MVKSLTIGLILSVSSAAIAQEDSSFNVHFSAQEIGMQVRYSKDMSLNSMCFIVGSTGHARNKLRFALFNMEQTSGVEDMRELSGQIDTIVSELASLCDSDGKVYLNSAAQPVYTNLGKKPKASEVPDLLKAISTKADQIVRINIDELKTKKTGVKSEKAITDCEVNGHSNICVGK